MLVQSMDHLRVFLYSKFTDDVFIFILVDVYIDDVICGWSDLLTGYLCSLNFVKNSSLSKEIRETIL